MLLHKWYPGKQESYGSYVFRDDTCPCGCVRRMVLNDKDKQEIESYSIGHNTIIAEPVCSRRAFKRTNHGTN